MCPTSKRSATDISSSCTSQQTGMFAYPGKGSNSIQSGWLGLISDIAGVVQSKTQQIATVTNSQPDVKPAVTDLPVSGGSVTDLHLGPLFTTTIRLPEPVTSVAVRAPAQFEVEHSDLEPRLVFVKPTPKNRQRATW